MKKNNATMRKGWVWVAFLALALSACALPEEGCLDPQAVNFSVEADKACADCCVYPQLRVDLLHKARVADTLQNIILETGIYQDGVGNPVRFKDIRFYISELQLLRTDAAGFELNETLLLRQANPGGDSLKFEVENNFALLTASSLARVVLGTFRQGGEIKGLRLKLGVAAPARNADPASAPSGHPLNIQSVSMWTQNQGYLNQRMALYPGTGQADTIPQVFELASGDVVKTIELLLPQPVTLPPGFHAVVALRMDYAEWLKNVNILQDSPEEILRKIADNVPNSIAVTQITAQEN